MIKRNKYKIIVRLFSTFGVLLLLSIFSYVSSPSSTEFDWNSINPLNSIEAMVFTFSWVGIPLILSILLVLFLCILIWFLFKVIVQKIYKDKSL